jgi:hypothetical protein
MSSDEPGSGQVYALEARGNIAALRLKKSGIMSELPWCPGHKMVPEIEMADEWAKLAADESDAHGVEHLRRGRYGDQPEVRRLPPGPLVI